MHKVCCTLLVVNETPTFMPFFVLPRTPRPKVESKFKFRHCGQTDVHLHDNPLIRSRFAKSITGYLEKSEWNPYYKLHHNLHVYHDLISDNS